MAQLTQGKDERNSATVSLTAEIKIESKLALGWLEVLVRQPPATSLPTTT
jgi:hypothetical protein